MSASDKKKLRKEQTAAVLSEKQRQEQAEAKKLKIYTISFVAVMMAIVCIALGVLGIRAVKQSGVFEKNTIAAVIGDRELNSVELGYYYNDAINNYYSQWREQYDTYADSYLSMLGLDTTKPLNEQVYDEESGKTWDQFFVETAVENAKSDFALYNLAMSENFQLPEEEKTTLDNMIDNIEVYASLYGYSNANQYLRAVYGNGSDVDSFKEYSERSTIAEAYRTAHEESLTYEDADLRAHEKENYSKYNSYTYSTAYLSYTDFREGGTKDDKGNITYSSEDDDAAREAMQIAAEQLATAKSLDEFKEMIKTIKVNESSQLAVNDFETELHTAINTTLANWLAADERKEGEIGAVPNMSTTTNADGLETSILNGYYVTYFQSKTDNADLMSNVRHLLVKFQGGTTNSETNEVEYSEEEKAAAKAEAEGYLKTWQDGDANEESFIELVKKHSDDSSAADGGLFEDIHPDSSYVANFLNWSIDPNRKAGDAEVIETEYGYHVMYYVGDDTMTYRDYMITNELRTADQSAWYEDVLKPVTTAIKDTSKLNLDLILSAG